MKKIFVLGTIVTLLSLSVSAQRGVDATESQRIERGFNNGELTRAEKFRLQKDEARIKHERHRAMRDGKMNRHERKRLQKMRRHERREMFRLKHNGRRRVM